jgi:hypothetical protein
MPRLCSYVVHLPKVHFRCELYYKVVLPLQGKNDLPTYLGLYSCHPPRKTPFVLRVPMKRIRSLGLYVAMYRKYANIRVLLLHRANITGKMRANKVVCTPI